MDQSKLLSNLDYHSVVPVIEATGISKVYHIGKQMVSPVADISLQIENGEFIMVFGPSGAGKSTLLHILMGIEAPDVGEILLKGDSFYQYGAEARAHIRLKRFGYIPQRPEWSELLSVVDNVALPLILQGWKWKPARVQAMDALKRVNLDDHAHYRPSELSGGQQQKASIVRAFMNDPWIIFADEPTEHLDTQSVEEVIALLKQENAEKQRTIIMVTHDLQFLKHAHRWFFVKDGRLWDIAHQENPFEDIKEAIAFVNKEKEAEK